MEIDEGIMDWLLRVTDGTRIIGRPEPGAKPAPIQVELNAQVLLVFRCKLDET